ncbi:AI-2E family transporter [Candidatus Parcubacteria bacterium]|nr:AI-2E family transporter [Candidatus Parcubacteria bacterium]
MSNGVNEYRTIDISTATIVKVFAVIVALLFLYAVREIVEILVFAIIIAAGVNAPVSWLQRRGLPRTAGVVLVYLVFFALLGFVVYLVVPPLAEEVQALAARFPAALEKGFGNLAPVSGQQLENLLKLFGERLAQTSQGVLAATSRVVGGVASALITLVLSIYLAVRERGIEEFLRLITPASQEAYVISLWGRVHRKLGLWIQGQLLLGLIVGLLTYVGLYLLGVPYTLTLAILMGILELVPIVGPILGAIPGILVAFFISPFLAVATAALYVFVQQLENHLLVPLVTKKIVGVNPIVVILALLVGAKLGGIPGMILAVPLAAALAEYFEDVTSRRKAPSHD